MNKKVSIVIPVYNVADYLEECLNSILNQTYQNLEVIVVDDGSTDRSGMICERYAEKDGRIKAFHQENRGAACAKNTGLDKATGEYLTFIDSDDYAESDWIETMVNTLECNQADAVECSFVKEFKTYTVLGNNEAFKADVFTAIEYMDYYTDSWTNSLFWNKLFKSELTKGIRFRTERRCIDDEFYTYKVMTNANRIVRITNPLIHYRQRLSSVVFANKRGLQITDDALEILVERYQWIKEYFPSLVGKYLKHDVVMIAYFRKSFPFDKNSIKKCNRILWFYFKECMKRKADYQTIKELLSTMLRPVKNKSDVQQSSDIQNQDIYFQ